MDAADDLLQNKLVPHKITPRKTTYLACPSTSRGCGRGPRGRTPWPAMPMQMASPTRPAPPPPVSGAPRRRQQDQDENRRDKVVGDDGDGSQDAASKIWAKIRQFSGLSADQRRRNPSTCTTASVAASVSLPLPAACGADSRGLWRRKAGIDEVGSLLMQRQRLAAMGSKTSLTDRTNLGSVKDSLTAGKRRTSRGSGKGRRGSGRWGGFGGWFV